MFLTRLDADRGQTPTLSTCECPKQFEMKQVSSQGLTYLGQQAYERILKPDADFIPMRMRLCFSVLDTIIRIALLPARNALNELIEGERGNSGVCCSWGLHARANQGSTTHREKH